MLVIRGFEERVAALYRDGEVPGLRAPVDRAGGGGRRRVLAARPDRRDHVDPSRPRPLPREGPRPARDVRRADGARTQGTNRGRGGSMHIADPTIGIFGANGIVARRPADRGRRGDRRAAARATAASRWRSSATARSRTARSTKRSTSPRCGSCRWSSSARTTATPSSRRRRPSTRRRSSSAPPGYGVDYVAVDGNDVVATATAMRDGGRRRSRAGRGSRRRRGRHLPLARSLRRRPAALPDSPTRCEEWEARDPLLVHARAPAVGGRRPTTRSTRCSRRSRASSTTPSRRRGGSTRPAVATLTDFVTRPRPERRRAAAAGRRRAGVPHHGRDPRRARSASSPTTSACSSPASTSAPAATCSG